MTASDIGLIKRATGIPSLDAATHGGLPATGATLVVGEPGCGKTILGLQILACALEAGGGGIFMSFEESKARIYRDAASFAWGRRLHDAERCEVIDGQSMKGAEVSGAFDIEGLLAVLGMCSERVEGSWIVLDGIDQLLRRQPDRHSAIEQIATLDDWCERQRISLLLTGKPGDYLHGHSDHLAGIEFLLSTILVLSSSLVDKRLNRRLRIAKYRGTHHNTDEMAMIIDDAGIHLPYADDPITAPVAATGERISSGITRLDEVLDGGFYRGSTTLISGQPGTSKTTLGATFAEAAAERGERALFISFDEFSQQIVRNVATLGIDLQPHIDAGRLILQAHASWSALVEEHYMTLMQQIESYRPHCLIIDPASALLKSYGAESAFIALERILAVTRTRGITTVLTSLSEADDPFGESTLSHASTLADTWIVLRYQVNGGERNRSLSVVKSRGTAHSNQVREMIVSSRGIDLADAYQFGSEVLMGTARQQKENEEAAARQRQARERIERRRRLEREIDNARSLLTRNQDDLERLQEALRAEEEVQLDVDRETHHHRDKILRRRTAGRAGDADALDSGQVEGDQ